MAGPGTESIRRRRSVRRRALLALALLVLALAGWMYFNSVAGISGMPTSEMDWDGDGAVTRTEILQAWHAVAVKRTREGRRACSAYHWRGDATSIRVDCRTEFEPAAKAD
jgi:hypothetical protein